MGKVPVLRLDPDLGAEIETPKRALAERACLASVHELPQGEWRAEVGVDGERSGFGLLVLSGALCRRVEHRERSGAELVGPGDLLRPWDDRIGEAASIPTDSSWAVVDPARLALLDAVFARRAAPFPEIAIGLSRRALLRVRHISVLTAIAGQRRIETRLNMLFWHLADRFGRVRGDWVDVPLPLTHNQLAELVAARRPSVTTALGRLDEKGVLHRSEDGWLLRGPAPSS
ncbi:MAG TPA: Crp/Fnr family transcriptional regulator [Solirubrobacterales bacterium]|nr:Crp/Fnr family transcriptional regulator [Solirubrobacterales bacterium]